MIYGTEGWTLKAKQIKKIQSAEMWFYSRMVRVSWREKRTDESILKELDTKRKLVNFIKKRKLSFIGHACRSKCSLMKDIMQGKVEGKRGRGRPRMQYIENAKSWTGKISVRNIRNHRGQRGSAGSQRSTERRWIVSKYVRYLTVITGRILRGHE